MESLWPYRMRPCTQFSLVFIFWEKYWTVPCCRQVEALLLNFRRKQNVSFKPFNHKNLVVKSMKFFSCIWKLVVMKLDVVQLLKARSTHMCSSCFISPDLLTASLTPPYNISMLQWRGESADLVWLASLICDERGRAGAHGAAREPCGQVVLLPPCHPQPAADAPAKSAPATNFIHLCSPILKCRESNVKISPISIVLKTFSNRMHANWFYLCFI